MSDTRDEQKPFLRHGATKLGVGDDLRAAPFTDQVFDDDYYGRGRRGRSYGFLLGIVLGAVVAASVW